MAGSSKEYKLALKIAGMVDQSLGTSCSLTKRQIREIAREASLAEMGTSKWSSAMNTMGPGIDKAWSGAKKAVLTTAEAMVAAGSAVSAIGVASVNVGKDFESAMSSWQATASASEEEYAKARDAAMEMGRTTSKTATESAQALEYMALAGWDAETSIKRLPGILRLSEASGMDLARTSDLVTDSMAALGLEVDGLAGYLDVAATANNKSNQTAEQLMEAYLAVGGTMKNLNIPVTESATALGVLANRGLKGSEAGTALNAVMVNLTTGAGQAGKMMQKLGISAFDGQGKFIGLTATLGLINDKLSTMTEEEKNAALAAIGGKTHVDAMNDLLAGMNTLTDSGATEWAALREDLEGASGALEEMAETKLDNLEGDIAILESAMQDAGIRIYDGLNDPLRELTQSGTELVYDFSEDIADSLKTNMPTIKRYLKEGAAGIKEFSQPFLEIGGWMMDNPDVVAGGLAAIATTITSLKFAKTATDAAKAINLLKVAMAGNPLTAAIVGVATVGGLMAGAAAKIKIANEELEKQSLASHFGDIALSMEDLQDVAEDIVRTESIDHVRKALEEYGKLDGISSAIEDSVKEINKMNWKVSIGMQLTETEQESYKQAIADYVANVQEYATQARYAVSLNLDWVFEENDEQGQGIAGKINQFYADQEGNLADLGKQLNETVTEAFNDGLLEIDEVNKISQLQRQMAEIQESMAAGEFQGSLAVMGTKYGGNLTAESFQNLQEELAAQVQEANSAYEEAYSKSYASASSALSSGAINQSEFSYAVNEAKERYLQNLAQTQAQAANFQLETIMGQYADELDPAIQSYMQKAQDIIEEYAANGDQDWMSVNWDMMVQRLAGSDLDKTSKGAISQLLESMQPTMEQMEATKQQYEELGAEIPEALQKGISTFNLLDAMVNSKEHGFLSGTEAYDAVGKVLGEQIAGSGLYEEFYKGIIDEMPDALPDDIAEGIGSATASAAAESVKSAGNESIPPAVDEVYTMTQDMLNSKFADGNLSVTASVDVGLNPKMRMLSSAYPARLSTAQPHAAGGIFDQPHVGLVAEAGPEAIIPLNGSQNAVSLWEQAGQMLGANGGGKGGGLNVTYSPVYNLSGNTAEDVRQAVDSDYERFTAFMARFARDQMRLAL